MTHNITYNIHTSNGGNFEKAVDELLDKVLKIDLTPLRLVFFGSPDSNDQYLRQRSVINEKAKQMWGETEFPLLTYVAQKPMGATLAVETQMVSNGYGQTLRYGQIASARYIIAESETDKRLYTQGIIADIMGDGISKQADDVLSNLEQILHARQMPLDSIVRQWNYIEQITAINNDRQHYQDFNDARSLFYSKTEWSTGYPAATGIGTDFGGIMVEIDAQTEADAKEKIVPIDNPMQVAAHQYSNQVLIGTQHAEKTTPKFERAKAIVRGDKVMIYVSGTAAIRGEDSLADIGIAQQTTATLENIEYLICRENLKNHGIDTPNEPRPELLRIYLKREKDLECVRDIIDTRYSTLPVVYLLTDVCRDELLIEIEGIATNFTNFAENKNY